MKKNISDSVLLTSSMTRACIYCDIEKDDTEFSLEHVIPQFLGGAYASDKFKTRDVCKKCNNDLGLFVDAAFEKSWVVSNWLRQTAFAVFDPEKPTALPLLCMGNSSFTPPGMAEDEVCEFWLGPLGEQVYWIRPKDENLYWYVGGNPRTIKQYKSTAYFFFSERSIKQPQITWFTFRDAFSDRKKVKKIMCTEVQGENPSDIGFSTPDDIDIERINFFKLSTTVISGEMNNRIQINVRFDHRFMAKLALGVGYCLFGKKALDSEYGKELRKGLWYQEPIPSQSGDLDLVPGIRGATPLGHEQDATYKSLVSERHAVSLIIMPSKEGVAVNLSIGKELSWTVMCASYEGLEKSDLECLREGEVILLYKHLQKGLSLSLPEYLAYKLGHVQHPFLTGLNERVNKNEGYFSEL